jgi:hypothetical protein
MTMNVDEFWKLIEKTKIESNGDTDLQAQLLEDELVIMPLEEILDYHLLYRQLHKRADRGSLLDAAYTIGEGCSSDGFIDFRAWLIAQGKQVYEDAINDPDTLADYVSLNDRYETRAEFIEYVALKAYDRKTGEPPESYPEIVLKFEKDDGYYGCSYLDSENPSTEPFDDCIKSRYPKLYAKFWDS